jgi:hypothetical protein
MFKNTVSASLETYYASDTKNVLLMLFMEIIKPLSITKTIQKP